MINICKLLFSLSICLLLTSCDSPRKSQQAEPIVIIADRKQYEVPTYTVQEGDTVGSVAYQHNITRAELIELNDLTPPYELYAGQKLIIGKTNSSSNIDKINDNLSNNNYKFELVQEGGLVTNTDRTIVLNTSNEDTNKSNDDNSNNVILSDNIVNIEPLNNTTTSNEVINTSKYIWPVDKKNNKIIKHFKDTNEYTIIQAQSGTPVKAIADGVVKFAGTSQSEGTLGYGKMVIVKHSNPSRLTLYARLGKTNVTKGQKIKKGDKIGTIANSKNKNSNLYFSLMNVNNKNKRTYIDPESIID